MSKKVSGVKFSLFSQIISVEFDKYQGERAPHTPALGPGPSIVPRVKEVQWDQMVA